MSQHRHSLSCLVEVDPHGTLTCKYGKEVSPEVFRNYVHHRTQETITARRKAAGAGKTTHRHSDRCKNRWGAPLCREHILPMIANSPKPHTDAIYALGAPVFTADRDEGGKVLYQGSPIMRKAVGLRKGSGRGERVMSVRNEQVGTLFYSPHTYPSTPWQVSLAKLHNSHPGTPDPFRMPASSVFDFNTFSPAEALRITAARCESFLAWWNLNRGPGKRNR